MPEGTKSGARPFSDTPARHIYPADGEVFPDELKGADLVRTFHADRNDTDYQIKIKFAREATLYLVIDDRRPPPEWMHRDFQKSESSVRIGPFGDSRLVHDITADEIGEYYIPCRVWHRAVLKHETITLGTPNLTPQEGPRLMYCIAIR